MSRKNIIRKIQMAAAIVVLFFGLCYLHLHLIDGLGGLLLPLYGEDTVYSENYSNAGFKRISTGMREDEVLAILGRPMGEAWVYTKRPEQSNVGWFKIIFIIGDVVTDINKDNFAYANGDTVRSSGYSDEKFNSITKGMRSDDVIAKLGEPLEKAWGYSESKNDQSYRVRRIIFGRGRVIEIIHDLYVD